jgi:hypothetical protein
VHEPNPIGGGGPGGKHDDTPLPIDGGDGGGGSGSSRDSSTAQENVGLARGPVDFDQAYGALRAASGDLMVRFAGILSPECQGDLDAVGVNQGAVYSALQNVNILNGFGSTANYAQASFGNTGAYQANRNIYGETTVLQFFGQRPNVAAIAQANGNNIYIASIWINGMSAANQQGLLIHELLHNITGKVDYNLQDELHLDTRAASQNIGDKLTKDCLK